MQSQALKECCFDYLVTMIDLFQKLYCGKDRKMLVDFNDFKSVLAQCYDVMLRQVPIDDKRVLPRYVCDRIIDHFETLPL